MKRLGKCAGALVQRLRSNPKEAGKPTEAGRQSFEQESLKLLAENCGDVIFRFGLDGQARYISPSVERLYGYTLSEIYAMGGRPGMRRISDLSTTIGLEPGVTETTFNQQLYQVRFAPSKQTLA